MFLKKDKFEFKAPLLLFSGFFLTKYSVPWLKLIFLLYVQEVVTRFI